MSKYTIGLDYGTNSVRALLVDTSDGRELASSVFPYPHGKSGILLDPRDPDVARQHPQDYLDGALSTIKDVIAQAASDSDFAPEKVVGIGVDTTGSTPIPVDENGVPLAFDERFADELGAMVYLWKDHTGHEEAAQITKLAQEMRPQYLEKMRRHL